MSCDAAERERVARIRARAAETIHEQPRGVFSTRSARDREWAKLRQAARHDLEELLQRLLAELDLRGRPGLERVGPRRKPLLGGKPKPTGPVAYRTFFAQVDKGMYRGEPYRPMVQFYVTPNGKLLEEDGSPANGETLPRHVVALYEVVARLGVRLPVSESIAASPDWPTNRWPASE